MVHVRENQTFGNWDMEGRDVDNEQQGGDGRPLRGANRDGEIHGVSPGKVNGRSGRTEKT